VTTPDAATQSSDELNNSSEREPEDICFVIMPFGGWFDIYFDSIYCPAIKAAGLTPRRADDLYRPSPVVNDIWDLTQRAKIILADLTGKTRMSSTSSAWHTP